MSARQWNTKPVGEVFQVVGGGTPSKKKASYYGGDIPWATIRDMHTDVLSATEHSITEEGLRASSAKVIPSGEVIMASRVGLGKACLLEQDTAINQDIRALLPRESGKVDRRFCLYWLQSVEETIIAAGTGATVQGIKLPFIKSLPFPDISLEEQRRIVAVLDGAFIALERARALVEKNLADGEELFPTILGQAFRPEAPWPLRTISDLIDAQIIERPIDGNHGETHPKKADFVEEGVPFVMASDLKSGSVDQENCYFITEAQANSLRKGFAKDGDVLLSHKGTIGRAAILRTSLDYVMLTPQVTYYRVIDDTRLDREFLFYCLQSADFQKQMADIAGIGATRAYIGITRQHDLIVPLPGIEAQRELVARFKSAETKARKLSEKYEGALRDLADLRQSLLQRAFAGELTRSEMQALRA